METQDYLVRRATRITPGIADLEAAGELIVLRDGRSVYNELWDYAADWNTFVEVTADSPLVASLKYWSQTTHFNHREIYDSKSGLTKETLEISWDEAATFIEVCSTEEAGTICRVYRISYDYDLGFTSYLLAKSFLSHETFELTSLDLDD